MSNTQNNTQESANLVSSNIKGLEALNTKRASDAAFNVFRKLQDLGGIIHVSESDDRVSIDITRIRTRSAKQTISLIEITDEASALVRAGTLIVDRASDQHVSGFYISTPLIKLYNKLIRDVQGGGVCIPAMLNLGLKAIRLDDNGESNISAAQAVEIVCRYYDWSREYALEELKRDWVRTAPARYKIVYED